MNEEIVNPLLDRLGKPDIEESIRAILRHGDYWYCSKTEMYYAFNRRYWMEVPAVAFEKKFVMLFGVNTVAKHLRTLMNTFTIEISRISLEEMQYPRGLINLENGILDVKTGELSPHSKEYYFFSIVPCRFDPAATCPRWMKFLEEVTQGDEGLLKILQELFGYCLSPGNWLQNAFFLHGEGNNGKSVLLEVLRNLIGKENTSALSFADINERFRRVEIVNKLANICEETPTTKLMDSDIFKNLVTDGTITAEQKHKPAFSFKNMAKLVFSCNEVPPVKDHTHAFYRRLVIIPFRYTVPEEKIDRQLTKKLLQELPGILNWSLEGLKRITENECLTEAKATSEAKARFIREGDNVKLFLDEECELKTGARAFCQPLYASYKDFCEARGNHSCSEGEFGKRLRTHCPGVKREREGTRERRWFYAGLQRIGLTS